jgi:GH25 family lysozyme M1 (1,4-beta-N-acetylmuramidase)
MGKIVDISHHQQTIDWSGAKDEIDLAIIRVQYGSTTIDRKYKEYIDGCKKYNIPFAHYAYALFLNVRDAEIEARDFLNRMDKDAKFVAVDVEEVTVRDIKDLIPATQRFIDICKQAGYKVGLYSGEHFFKYYGLSAVKADFLWVAKYSKNPPSIPYDIWQYSSTDKVKGISTNVDVNVLNSNKSLSYFTGEPVFKEEELEMLEKAIVIGGYPDFPMAELVALTLHAPIYFRSAIPAGKIAKEVYVVGGSVDGIQADKVINLTGADRFAVVEQVKNFLGK